MDECQYRKDWPKWKDYIPTKFESLEKWEVFGPIVQTPEVVKLVGYKWVFIRKCNGKNEIMRYKAWFITQGFSQRLGIDYEKTYSPMMNAIIFRHLIYLAVSKRLDLLHIVVTTYLYGFLDDDIYMKIPKWFQMPKATNSKHYSIYSIKLQRSLYRLSSRKACGTITSMNIWNGKYVCITLFVYAYSLDSIFAIIIVYVEHWILLELLKSLQE